jgi:hypothetical protein
MLAFLEETEALGFQHPESLLDLFKSTIGDMPYRSALG